MAYIGNKMSERAFNAYQEGAKPLSKWTKTEILERIEIVRPDLAKKLSKASKKKLQEAFLLCTSWHHTGSYFNKTNFYEFNIGAVEDFDQSSIHSMFEKDEVKSETLEYVYFEYIEFEGSRRHPRKVSKSAYGIKKGNWIYILDQYELLTKKKADGNWISKIEKVSKSDDQETFEKLEKLI